MYSSLLKMKLRMEAVEAQLLYTKAVEAMYKEAVEAETMEAQLL